MASSSLYRMDEGEQLEQTIVREMREELGCEVRPIRPVHAYLYTIKLSMDESRGVLVLSYVCELLKRVGEMELMGEAGKATYQQFSLEEIQNLAMPDFYKEAIKYSCQMAVLY